MSVIDSTFETKGTNLYFIDFISNTDGVVTKMTCPTGITGLNGGTRDKIDTTCLDETGAFKTYIGGFADSSEYTVPFILYKGDAGHQALFSLHESGDVVGWFCGFSDSTDRADDGQRSGEPRRAEQPDGLQLPRLHRQPHDRPRDERSRPRHAHDPAAHRPGPALGELIVGKERLLARGGILSFKKKYDDGTEETFHYLARTSPECAGFRGALADFANDEKGAIDRDAHMGRLILASMCAADGAPLFTADDVLRIPEGLKAELCVLIISGSSETGDAGKG
jgi:hypothetical protein